MLEVRDLEVHYGNIPAVKRVSLTVGKGQIVAIIGSNGAGKSTTLKAMAGLLPVSGGTITLNGRPITGLSAEDVVRRGLALCPEGRKVFGRLTVMENLRMGAYIQKDRKTEARLLAEVFQLFPRLEERAGQLGGTLSGGEQQMLAIGRCLMANPSCLLLDEPSMGLAPKVIQDIAGRIRQINQRGVSVLLVEQNAYLALSLARYCYVFETGQLVTEGPSQELLHQDAIRSSYLGA